MDRVIGAAVLATAVVAGTGAVLAARRRGTRPAGGAGGWVAVTVLRTADEIAPGGELPEPLRRLGDRIRVRTQPAPGDRGTEVYARLATAPRHPSGLIGRLTGQDALAPLRIALRESKALAETGEVVPSDAERTTHPGPAGKLLRAVDRASQGAGRL